MAKSFRSYPGFSPFDYTWRLTNAINKYGLPASLPIEWEYDINNEAFYYLKYMQPDSALIWIRYLSTAMKLYRLDQRKDLATLTIIDKRWHFGEEWWNFSAQFIKNEIQRIFLNLNYILLIEFGVYRNYHHHTQLGPHSLIQDLDEGRLIAPHAQGVIWHKRPTRAQRKKFSGGIFNAHSVHVRDVHDFDGAVRYMVKPPYRGQSVIKRASGRCVSVPWPDMNLTLHHLLLSNLGKYTFPELTFAGGEGVEILQSAKDQWRKDVRYRVNHPISPGGLRWSE
jgi:hypothetical protein